MQIAEVNKALGSISWLVDHGYKVVFDKCMRTGADLSIMIKKDTKKACKFRRERNIWVLDAYVTAEDNLGFSRHG